MHADCAAQQRRSRPQARTVAADPVLLQRVLADLGMSRTPRQIAGRLRLEAADATVGLMDGSLPAGGATASHEAVYQFICVLPKGDLARHGILLRSKRTRRKPRTTGRAKRAPIVGMVSIDARDPDADGRRVPGHWEGDLIIAANGATAAATLVERTSRHTVIVALPAGKDSAGVCDALIERADALPAMMRRTPTWDQGTEMAEYSRV